MRPLRSLAALLVVLSVASCAGSRINAARTALTGVAKFGAESADAFAAFDRKRQEDIARKHVGDVPAGIAELDAWSKKTDAVVKAFERVRQAVGVGEALVALVETGAKGDKDLTTWLVELHGAAEGVRAALKEVGLW